MLCSPCKLFSQRYFFVFLSSRAATAVHSAFFLLEINVVSKWKKSHLKYFSICKNGNNDISFTGVLYIPIIGLALSEASPLSQCGLLSPQLPPHVFAQELILSNFSDALILFKAGNLSSCLSSKFLIYTPVHLEFYSDTDFRRIHLNIKCVGWLFKGFLY